MTTPTPPTLDKSDVIEIWKKTIDVQEHFNDLELRIRNFAITVLVGVLGVAGYALKEKMLVQLFGRTFNFAVLLLLAGIIAWVAFYFMDRWWYHRLLYGAVMHGLAIEERHKKVLPELGLTTSISDASPIVLRGEWKIRTTAKIDLFYGAVLLLLFVIMGLLYSLPTPVTLPSEKDKAELAATPTPTASPDATGKQSP